MKQVMICLLITLFSFTTLFISKAHAQKKFSIAGNSAGFADSTLLFLDDLSDGSFKSMDSAYIINGIFKFTGSLKEKVIKAALRTKDFNDRTYFWLEQTSMTVYAEKGKFKEAVFAGSATETAQHKLNKATAAGTNEKALQWAFIQSNPSSVISAYLLSVYCSQWNRDSVMKMYKPLFKEIKNTLYGKNVGAYLKYNKSLKTGSHYADLKQPDSSGKMISLSGIKDKIILLEFWGSWCGPCREGHPELINIYNEFKNKGFEILGVAAETKRENWINALQKDNLPWLNVTDLKGDKNIAALTYGVAGYPTNFLINKEGIIIAKDLRGEDLRKKLKELFN